MSRFSVVESAPPVEIFALSKAFKEDTFGQKVDLGIGGKGSSVLFIFDYRFY
jgi:aspartate/tyrosine/aromatic aminotransferase